MRDIFQSCEICGSVDWQIQYQGKVRDGAFGNLSKDDCIVARCGRCGVERLDECACKDDDFYETEEYRRLLKEPEDAKGFWAKHDVLQLRNLTFLWPDSLRCKMIADIGCGAGSFLDHVCGLARGVVCVEPCKTYHESLQERGYRVYSHINDAVSDWGGKIDYAFCFSVIEHVQSPRVFLEEMKDMLAPEGRLVLSTPNRRDILTDLKGDEYKRFFYRTVHRWYFDADSLTYCAREAGLRTLETRCIHRFGLSNAMAWLRDGKPTGSAPLPHLESRSLDHFWKDYLESRGVGDYLYFKLERQTQ